MAIARRFLPSTSLLYSFEASARHQSFTSAAEELNLTQSAVSRHIRALEEHLGAALFTRDRQTVRLTRAGDVYAREIRAALRYISSATLAFRANPGGGTVSLGVQPTLGTQWLAPRLASFMEQHPDITVNLYTHLHAFEFTENTLDAAIHFGAAEWPGSEVSYLMPERVVPVCTPELYERFSFRKCEDLLSAPLLHLVSRPDAWERWFVAQNIQPTSLHGPLFDQFSFVVGAALGGAGCALVPRFLVEKEISTGQLLELVAHPLESEEAYYFARPLARSLSGALETFHHWLLQEVAVENGRQTPHRHKFQRYLEASKG